MSEKEEAEEGNGAQGGTGDDIETKSENASQDTKTKLENVSEYITVSDEDVGKSKYRFSLLSEHKNAPIEPNDKPDVTISETNRLKIVIDDKVYLNKKLPGGATICEVKVKTNKLVILLEKAESKKWKR